MLLNGRGQKGKLIAAAAIEKHWSAAWPFECQAPVANNKENMFLAFDHSSLLRSLALSHGSIKQYIPDLSRGADQKIGIVS